MPSKPDKPVFKIQFMNQGQVFEIYAHSVNHGSMLGFVEVADLALDERRTVLVDPGLEKVRTEFEGVRRTYMPMHSVLRIDEVEKQGTSKVSKAEGSNVAQFPIPVYTPGSDKS